MILLKDGRELIDIDFVALLPPDEELRCTLLL